MTKVAAWGTATIKKEDLVAFTKIQLGLAIAA